ncbi:hypothetical protein JHN52_15615 [Streptomyces sp. MBT97]|uniref:hypothetical protein n=1 Tax=Streptomyces sp. MBT97 TaxID=2800411 RepID=UPI00190E2A93|nr:hypothetical protein [Streptomyces sp. MBT97]MBK3634338.1 hypothetical protein [Streptomyces sp. MBT97]
MINYHVGSEGASDGESVRYLMRRQEAESRKENRAGERFALHEAISLIRLGVGSCLRVPDESHLGDRVTRAIICAEIMAGGNSITIGDQVFTPGSERDELLDLAYVAAMERHRLLPTPDGKAKTDAYISPGWPTDEECARLAHKLTRGMGYSQAEASRIIESVDGWERPHVWSRQGIDRLLWDRSYGEKWDRFTYVEKSRTHAYLEGRRHLPCSDMDCMAVFGSLEHADSYDSSLSESHGFTFPSMGLAATLQLILDTGCIRTLFVSESGSHFSSDAQRALTYDLALYRGVQVVENRIQVKTADRNPNYNRILREGTQLFTALRAHSNATITDETRSRLHAWEVATDWHARKETLRAIATHLNEEAIPTLSGTGRWSPSAVKKLLDSGPEADQ